MNLNLLLKIFRKTKPDPYQMKERFGYIPTISKPKGRGFINR